MSTLSSVANAKAQVCKAWADAVAATRAAEAATADAALTEEEKKVAGADAHTAWQVVGETEKNLRKNLFAWPKD